MFLVLLWHNEQHSQYFYKEDKDCLLQNSHFIRELVKTKKQSGLLYGFKYHCTSIHERFSKLKDCLQSSPNNQRKIFSSFGNELLPPSRNITLKYCPIIYPLKQKYLYDYNPICLMSSGLIFYDIIMNILRNKKMEFHDEEENYFLQRLRKPFRCTGVHFNTFTGRKSHTNVWMLHVYISIFK